VVGHLVVGWDPVERAWVVIHTYLGRLGLTITPKKSGSGRETKTEEKLKKKSQKTQELEKWGKKKGVGRARAHSCCCARRQRSGACGGLVCTSRGVCAFILCLCIACAPCGVSFFLFLPC
jgi:hypothetical protein